MGEVVVSRFRLASRWVVLAAVAGVACALPPVTAGAASGGTHRYVVVMQPSASPTALQASATAMGANVLSSTNGGRVLVVSGTEADRAALAAQPGVLGVGADGIKRLFPPE